MVTGSTVDFFIQFWGVRGKISSPGKNTIRYGGNTSCVEMRVGKKRLIFDGGTGLRVLGNKLLSQMPVEAHLFFTNCHWDNIQGFPFFTPAFIPGNCFHIYGAAASNGSSMEQRLARQMQPPTFPVPIQVMQSELQFYSLTSGEKVSLDDVTVEMVSLNSLQSSMGYRVTWHGYSVVYATARSLNHNRLDDNLLRLAYKADLLILDAPYRISADKTLNSDVLHWQDEIWQTSIATAKAADVKQVVISRYNPDYDDDFLDQMEERIQSTFPSHSLAREGMIVPIF
ncbi:MAG: MBL fold metallo-hydrolase [Symploca sp. SIO2C1]|nr:MBL fold metallo-hydrolase [Symploca sp. SIO2C1]